MTYILLMIVASAATVLALIAILALTMLVIGSFFIAWDGVMQQIRVRKK